MSAPAERWFEDAFEAEYLALYAHRDATEALAQVDQLIDWGWRDDLIDLGCGFGRHLHAFAKRGVRAFGVDRSTSLIAAAPAEVRPRIVRGDLRALPFRTAGFDGAVSLFSSFGYFGPLGDRDALREVARVLRPGGRLCLDLADPGAVRSSLVAESAREVGALRFRESRQLEELGRLVVKQVTATSASGRTRSWQERLWLYEKDALRAMSQDVGFDLEDARSDFGGSASSGSGLRRVWTLRRR